jgi:uncharacterized protein (DUF983 family)
MPVTGMLACACYICREEKPGGHRLRRRHFRHGLCQGRFILQSHTNMPQSKAAAIAACQCPRCREGAIFTHPPLALGHIGETHEKCPACGLRYEIEPGFFWASMYISYAINVAIMVAVLVANRVLFNPSGVWPYFIPVVVAILLAFPFTMRYSRVLLLHLFASVSYNPNWREQYGKS